MKRSNLSLLAFLVIVSGCDQSSPGYSQARTSNLAAISNRLDVLEMQVAANAQYSREWGKWAAESNFDLVDVKARLDNMRTAILTPANKAYSCLETDQGRFYVVFEDAKPYLDGQKVTFQIGNPHNARYGGLTVKVKWGTAKPDLPSISNDTAAHLKAYREWCRGLREKVVTPTNELRPGCWNAVEVVLSPAKADELGYIEVSISTTTVNLDEGK